MVTLSPQEQTKNVQSNAIDDSNRVTLAPNQIDAKALLSNQNLGYRNKFTTCGICYTIREAAVEDADAIANHRVLMLREVGFINVEVAIPLEAANREQLVKLIEAKEYMGWLLETDDKIIASGGAVLRQLLPGANNLRGGYEAHILNVYTEPDHRRRGLAEKIVLEILDWCNLQRIDRISLNASKAGRPIYEKLGFKQTNEMRYQPAADSFGG